MDLPPLFPEGAGILLVRTTIQNLVVMILCPPENIAVEGCSLLHHQNLEPPVGALKSAGMIRGKMHG
jgi:hypothetical protein